MIWSELQTLAQTAVAPVLNSLPEGLLVALFAWGTLHVMPRHNSRTRFAIWFIALLTIVALPCIGFTREHSLLAASSAHSLIELTSRVGLFIFLFWILAASIALLRLAIGLWHLRALRRDCTAIDESELDPRVRETVRETVRNAAAEFSSSRSVTLTTSGRVSVPAAIGFFRPMIVLPHWALNELTPDELRVILLHEFAHLQRWDDWTNLLQKIVRALFLFHPAVWWIDNKLSLEREMACDDLVLAETDNPRGYAQCLISLLERNFSRRGWTMAQAVVHRAHEASLRLARILDASRPRSKRIWKPALGVASAFSVICFAVMAQAPQFVAFGDRTAPSTQTLSRGEVASTAGHFQLGDAAVIPAVLRVNPASQLKHKYQRRTPEHKLAPQTIQEVAGNRLVENSEVGQQGQASARVVPVSGSEHHASTQTLLLVRTTERVGPNLWVSSVYVYRLAWVMPAASQVKPQPVKPAVAETRPMAKTT
jgi:beta-lactamase regulating signal transducer with metallopeptidase domain